MSAQPIRASVAICAYTEDRWEDTVAAVSSALGQEPPPLEVIVVVDNNDALRRRLQKRFSDCRIVPSKGRLGASAARNTAIELARGEVIVFLDDDARAREGWIAGLLERFQDPDVMSVGIKVLPLWPAGRPKWFPEEFDWVVGCSHRGLPTTTGPVRNPIGSSMAFRLSALRAIGGFDGTMGRVGHTAFACEETEVSIRLRQAFPDGEITYDPAIIVDHRVTASRTRFTYFRARCWAEGVSKAQVRSRVGARDALAAERRYVSRVLPLGVLRGLLQPPSGWRRAFAILAGLSYTTAGYAVHQLRLALHGGQGGAYEVPTSIEPLEPVK